MRGALKTRLRALASKATVKAMSAAHRSSDIRNKIGGFLFGYFFAAFCIFLFIVMWWAHNAPTSPAPALGALYRHNEHGWITFFTAFQATSSALMFWSNFLAIGVAIAILPKRNLIVRRLGGVPLSASWKHDDQKGLATSSAAYGALAAPLVILFFGPMLVSWLSSYGVVLNL